MSQGHTPFGLIHFWGQCGVPFSLYSGKGKCCMWLINKVEIDFARAGFVDCKWSNLNAPGLYLLWSHSPAGVYNGVAFLLYAGKWKSCMWLVNQEEIHFAKVGFMDCKWSILNAPGSYTLWSHSLLGSPVECPFLCMLHVAG